MVTKEEKIATHIFKEQNNPLNMSDAQLLVEYRFDPHSIFHLTEIVKPDIEQQTLRSYALPAVLPVLIASKFFACRTYHSVIGDFLKVHKSTICRAAHRVTLSMSST